MEKHRSAVLKSQQSSKGLASETMAPTRNMSVAIRIRPLSSKEINSSIPSCCSSIGGGIVCIKKSGDLQANLKSQTADSVNDFAFDNVFTPENSQAQVYETIVKPVVMSFLGGENGTVFAYGATGAGKSFTMLGQRFADPTLFPTTDEENSRGIIQRALEDVLTNVEDLRAKAALGETISLHVSFCEIYNDQVQDLLAAPTVSSSILPQPKYLQLREDADRGVVEVAGLSERTVHSVSDAIDALKQGTALRRTDATGANLVSSRSHAIIQLQLRHLRRASDGRERLIESRFTFVDLAGSERASATNNRGTRLQEGANINKSLLALGNCINALSENRHVKYRDSKLTLFLKPSLEGNCNLVMVANINPALTSYEDSLHTLSYAARAKNIKIRPEVRERLLESTSLERECRLRDENALLKQRVEQLEQECQRLRQSEANYKAQLLDNQVDGGDRRQSKENRRKSRLSFGFIGRSSNHSSNNSSSHTPVSSRPPSHGSASKRSSSDQVDSNSVDIRINYGADTADNSSNGEAEASVGSVERDEDAGEDCHENEEDRLSYDEAAEDAKFALPDETDAAYRQRKQQNKNQKQRGGLWQWFICGGHANDDVR